MTTRIRLVGGILVAAALALVCGCGVPEDDTPRASARVAVVVDETGSFVSNLATAAKVVGRFIRENALGGDSEIYLIALDRKPRVLHYYKAEEILSGEGNLVLKAITQTNPADGTDVVGALRLANMKLHKYNGVEVDGRYLLVFSDMVVDPAKTPQRVDYEPLERLEWGDLSDVTCRFYFVANSTEPLVTKLTDQHGVKAMILDAKESARVRPGEEIEGQ